jgi:hypothetical protein
MSQWHSARSTGGICAGRGLWRSFLRRWSGWVGCVSRLRGRIEPPGLKPDTLETLRGAEAPLFHVTASFPGHPAALKRCAIPNRAPNRCATQRLRARVPATHKQTGLCPVDSRGRLSPHRSSCIPGGGTPALLATRCRFLFSYRRRSGRRRRRRSGRTPTRAHS